jgi:hypothetical protein
MFPLDKRLPHFLTYLEDVIEETIFAYEEELKKGHEVSQ